MPASNAATETPSTEAAARTVDAALIGADPELGMRISKLPAAQRCEDDTTSQMVYTPDCALTGEVTHLAADQRSANVCPVVVLASPQL
jgi:hypothetical protein